MSVDNRWDNLTIISCTCIISELMVLMENERGRITSLEFPGARVKLETLTVVRTFNASYPSSCVMCI